MPPFAELLKFLPELELDQKKKRILLIYMGCLALVFGIYFYLFLKPGFVKLFDLIPRVRELKMDIKVVRDDLLFQDKLEVKSKTLEKKLGRYGKKLSREKELPKLLENLSKIARDSHVKILGITPLGQVGGGKEDEGSKAVYQEVPIVVSAQSGYHELGEFINKLENDERYMQISDIKIKSNRSNPKRHDVEFVVYAYTFKGD